MGSSEEGEGEGEGSHLMDEHEKPPSRQAGMPRAVPMAGLAVLVLVAWFSYGGSAPEKSTLRVATWNIAAINNNPFEYWITHDDADYNALMEGVQSFIDQPGERDVPVSEVFTPAMWAELKALMTTQGWGGVEETEAMWQASFGQRKIISGFMKDRSLGEKRLASMPDRVTNTINLAGGRGVANRPTVINCFAGDMTSSVRWWANWKAFMFETKVLVEGGGAATLPASLLQPIKRAKYPALTVEEETISIPLQTLCQAIFDAILVYIVNIVSPSGKWQQLQQQMCDSLNRKKDANTLAILDSHYSDINVFFVQEAAAVFVAKANAVSLGKTYSVISSSSLDGKRDQNSLILICKQYFDPASVREHTAEVMATFDKATPVANGDLLVISAVDVFGRSYLLASFHGDTNGLATLPVLAAVHALARRKPSHRLVFGLDANTYAHGSASKQGVVEFGQDFVSKGYSSCWGDAPDPTNHTTFNARTFLQPQLQKAAKSTEKASKGDKNPKDFILFPKAAYSVVATTKDNTGRRRYTEGMVFPTLQFPSDHGLVATVLREL
uniref:Endonuclease/exonuclease/phosphatase domain-containing protein n=1 Tax=Phaeocystis antarctica TaxID=33657 RepID=A0A7S0EEX2_9EUKA